MMWFNRPLDFARSVFRTSASATPAAFAAVHDLAPNAITPTDLHFDLGRPELDRLAAALLASIAPAEGHLDDPARLAAALDLLVVLIDGAGRTRVVLRPAGLATPEAWQISVTGADSITIRAFDRLRHGIPIPVQSTGGIA